jgi:hypothetical protein
VILVCFQRYLGSVLGYMAKYGPNLFAAWQNSDDLLITWQNRYLPYLYIKRFILIIGKAFLIKG